MGQLLSICTGSSGEATKPSAFDDANDGSIMVKGGGGGGGDTGVGSHHLYGASAKAATKSVDERWSEEMDRQQALQKEQARLKLIVSKAGREMVSVGSTRGANYYNDQGFAAALAQHLQQTLPPTTLKMKLPTPPQKSVYQVMSQPIPSGPPDLDHQAEAFLAKSIVRKEHLFAGCPPIVENPL